MVAELAHLREHVTSLQQRMTEMVLEKRAHRARVMEFRQAFALPVNYGAPVVPEEERVRVHLRLVCEEFFELLESSIGTWTSRPWVLSGAKERTQLAIDHCPVKVDLPEVVDALADLDYIVEGFRQELGVVGEPVADVVHASNMAKVGGKVNALGKLTKPEGWLPPDIEGELRRQGWRT